MPNKIRTSIKHKHHIIPCHIYGGRQYANNHPSNKKELTVAEHAAAHKKLWEETGNEYDRIAYLALSGMIGKEEIILERARLGGSIQGKKNAQSGHMRRIQKLSPSSANGKKSVEYHRMRKSGPYFDPKLRLQSSTKGGYTQGKRNVENGHCKKISKVYWSKAREVVICPHCGKEGVINGMKRWHFDKCRNIV